VVLPPRNDQVERFRQDFDPLAEAIPAHITLVYPTSVGLGSFRDAMSAAAGRPSFGYAFSGAAVVEHEYLFLLADRGAAKVRGLHEELYRQLGLPLPEVFQPHVTVARTSDAARLGVARTTALAQGLRIDGTATQLCLYRIDGPASLALEHVVPLTPSG
jgi:2'-5' RNA ligase